MDYSDIIIELSKRYNELQKEFQSVQDLVNDIDFVFNFTEEEQWLFYRMRSTMEEHCGALLRLIRFLKKQAREESDGMFKTTHDPNFDEIDPEQKAQALHHCGQDAACDEQHGVYFKGKDITSCIGTPGGHTTYDMSNPEHVRKFNEDMERMFKVQDPNESQPADTAPESLHELIGTEVVGAYPPGWKCDGCIFSTMEDARCTKKVELVGGYFLCLAPLPNSIVTE